MRGDFRTAAPLGESASERPADENFQFASTLFVLELCLCVCISSHDYYFILLFFFEILSTRPVNAKRVRFKRLIQFVTGCNHSM